jgi:hypothetical protein
MTMRRKPAANGDCGKPLLSFDLVFTVGRFGVDGTGSIRIVHRFARAWARRKRANRRRQTT